MSRPTSELTEVLGQCIEALEQGQTTLAECLTRYPNHADALQELLPVMLALRDAPDVAPTARFRQEARQRLLAKVAPAPVANVTFWAALRRKWQTLTLFPTPRRLSMTWLVGIVVAASLLLGGGTVLAADGAAPGEFLYPLDLAVEEARLSLHRDPSDQVSLYLDFAAERLDEAGALAAQNDDANFDLALDGYGTSIAAIARTIGSVDGPDQAALGQLLEEALSAHDARLAALPAPQDADRDPDDGADDDGEKTVCASGEFHPVAQGMADTYEVDPVQIMDWFCGSDGTDGFGFGQIMLALRTADGDVDQAQAFLDDRAGGLGWGQIWLEEGLVGPPDSVGPPDDVPQGPPDNVGPPDGVPQGPPDNVGPPDGVPQGPPDNVGPPDGVPQGPPDNVGPPDGVPQGPPDNVGPPDDVPQGPPDSAGPPDDVPHGPPAGAGPPADRP